MHVLKAKTVCVFFVLIYASHHVAIAEDSVRITTGEWAPYLSQYLPHFGPLNRIVTEAFALEDVEVKFGFYPWKRAIRVAKSGTWDGTSLWGYHEERLKDFYHSEIVTEQKYVFFHLRSLKFDWKSYDDLKGFVIGAAMGYNYHEEFQSNEKMGLLRVERVPMENQNIFKLLSGRIQLALMEIVVGHELIRNHTQPADREKIMYHPKIQSSDGLHLLLSKKTLENEIRIAKFNKGLRALKAKGTVDKYIKDAIEGKYKKLEETWSPEALPN